MGKKLYQTTETGGILFKTERRIGDVRIPNYVYDLWLPVLGAVAVGVYGVYCRLEREQVVKAMTQKRIATMCRIGTNRLRNINEMLQDCSFISIKPPEGAAKLMHWTLEITVLDPPQEVRKEIIEKYAPADYEILSPWLLDPSDNSSENPNGIAGEPKQQHDEDPNGIAIVVPLGLNPLEVESESKPEKQKDVLDHIFEHHFRQQAKPEKPKGWAGVSDGEFEICEYVARLWCNNILPRRSEEIEKQIAGAAELLDMHDKNTRAAKETISAYHDTRDGRDLWVSGPHSLTNVLPNFMTRSRRDSPLVVRIGR